MRPQVPNTDSIAQLARFWDTNDVADFEDELEEVSDTVFARAEAVPVLLTAAERDAVRRIAAARGLAESALIQEWVKEKLHT